jgi:hypothetical protein
VTELLLACLLAITAPFQVRRIPLRPPKVKKWEVKGWRGMYDSRDKGAEREDEAPFLINLIPLDTDRGGALELRPGMKRLITPTTTQIPTLDSWQCAIFCTLTFGGSRVVFAAGGEIYTLNITTGVVTLQITAAQLTAAAITFGSLNPSWVVQFGSVLVFSQANGSHAFTWDGTSGGGLVKLTNAPTVRQASPTVYYSKLFFIKSASTIVWSEEGQANTGYEAGGFNNAWDLIQTTSADALEKILGTNEGLFFWRFKSAGVIRGAVSSTFQTDGVHDGVTQQAGSGRTHGEPVQASGAVWWLSSEAHPMVYRPDVGAIDLARQLPRRFASPQGGLAPGITYLGSIGEQHPVNSIAGHEIVVDTANERVQFELVDSVATRRTAWVFDAVSLKLLTTYLYPNLNKPGGPNSQWAVPVPVSAPGTTPLEWVKLVCDTDGFLFTESLAPAASPARAIGFDEIQNGAGTAIDGTLIGPMHGHSADLEWHFFQLEVLADALQNNDLTVGYVTSKFHKASLTPVDQNLTDTATSTPFERHKAFGLNTSGRWFRPIITVSGEATINRLPQLHGYTLRAVPVSETPTLT